MSYISFLRRAVPCVALASIVSLSDIALANGHLQKIVMLGDTAPGADGQEFSAFSSVLFDRAGAFAVYAFLADSGGSLSPGIWTYRDTGGLQLAVRHGDIAPAHDGSAAGAFDFFKGPTDSSFRLNANGDVAFYSHLGSDVDPAQDEGVWVAHRGVGPRLVARKGDIAPGTNGKVFHSVAPFYVEDNVEINDAGHVAFAARLSEETLHVPGKRGVWSDRHGLLEAVAVPGGEAPGLLGGSFESLYGVMLSNSNQIAFGGEVVGHPTEPESIPGLWASTAEGDLRIVFSKGQPVEGATGMSYSGAFDIVQGEHGQTAIIPQFQGPDSSAQGLWMELPGAGLQKILTPNDVAPDGDRVGSFVNCCLTTNDVGDVALTTDRGGLWIANSDGDVRRVADHGQTSPGIDKGKFSRMQSPSLNNRGHAAFAATVTVLHGIASNNEPITTTTSGVWVEDAHRELKMVLKAGELIDVDTGPGTDVRSLVSAQVLGFDDLGRVALRLRFSDKSYGVFLSAPVPEPSTRRQSWLAGITVAVLLTRHGRRRQHSVRLVLPGPCPT